MRSRFNFQFLLISLHFSHFLLILLNFSQFLSIFLNFFQFISNFLNPSQFLSKSGKNPATIWEKKSNSGKSPGRKIKIQETSGKQNQHPGQIREKKLKFETISTNTNCKPKQTPTQKHKNLATNLKQHQNSPTVAGRKTRNKQQMQCKIIEHEEILQTIVHILKLFRHISKPPKNSQNVKCNA